MSIAIYLLKTTIVFITLFLFYDIFLKDVTNLRLRRIYLHATTILSFLIPLVSKDLLPYHYHSTPESLFAQIDEAARYVAAEWLFRINTGRFIPICLIVILSIYFIIVSGKHLLSFLKMQKFIQKAPIVTKNKYFTLRIGHSGKGSFNFFKTIYLHSLSTTEHNARIVLEHEKAHVRQRHYIDLWLSALYDYFIWFFPLIKPYQKAIEEVVECQADREAINSLKITPLSYQSTLYSSLQYANSQSHLASHFRSLVTQRLLFISKKKQKNKSVYLRLLFPIVAVSLLIGCFAYTDVLIHRMEVACDIRKAGYNLEEVSTGYVIDRNTKSPVNNAIIGVASDKTITVTDEHGCFFIKKTLSRLNVRHVGYETENTAANEWLIRVEPSFNTVAIDRMGYSKKDSNTMRSASFPMGETGYERYIASNLKYPKNALINKINGTVWITAKIDESGQVQNVEVLQGVNDTLNKEAIRLVENMPKWDPAIQNNVHTSVLVMLPVRFTL